MRKQSLSERIFKDFKTEIGRMPGSFPFIYNLDLVWMGELDQYFKNACLCTGRKASVLNKED